MQRAPARIAQGQSASRCHRFGRHEPVGLAGTQFIPGGFQTPVTVFRPKRPITPIAATLWAVRVPDEPGGWL